MGSDATLHLLTRLGEVSTTSLVDAASTLRILPPALRPIVPGRPFAGPVRTARANRDLMSVIAGLRECAPGEVLMVDAGGDDRAVAGELFGTEAQRRGLAALVIMGRSRDTATLARMDIPIWSTGYAPNAYAAQALPEVDVPLSLGGVTVAPGDLIIGDDDGLVVGTTAELAAAIDGAEAIEARERRLQAAILGGASLFDAMNFEEHLAALRAGRPGGLSFA
ncbi:MAG: RraA family protein [Actinobacteria bacterium]|nr:RraA family protein [Actinomycetota bacterium]